MNESPYIVPQLAATRAGIPDPLGEIRAWLVRLQDLPDIEPQSPNAVYDLFALWSKLQRARPELLVQLGAAEALQRAAALLAERGPSLAARALRVPDLRGGGRHARRTFSQLSKGELTP